MSLSIINQSPIKDGDLVAVNSIMPFTVAAESAYNTRVIADIYKGYSHSQSPLTPIAEGLELLQIDKRGSQVIFRADLSHIIKSIFDIPADTLQNAGDWLEIPELLEDIVIKFTATNGSDTDAVMYVEFTVWNRTTQFGNDITYGNYSESDATSENIISTLDKKLNTEETIYCQAGNVVYIYAILSDEGSIVTPDYEALRYFVDGDGTYLCDENWQFTKEEIL